MATDHKVGGSNPSGCTMVPWCNGSTTGSGPVSFGSNPSGTTIFAPWKTMFSLVCGYESLGTVRYRPSRSACRVSIRKYGGGAISGPVAQQVVASPF